MSETETKTKEENKTEESKKLDTTFVLGKKLHMTQVFTEDFSVSPGTIIEVGPMTVTQVKTKEKDGYSAVQIGFGSRNEKNINKAQKTLGNFEDIREIRLENDTDQVKKGDVISPIQLEAGDKVRVTAISKGKGFQGVVKRHNFAGGRRSHGQKHSEREAGSIGIGGVQRVMKGKKMPGRMGGDKITTKNLVIAHVDAENNTIVVKGAVPGRAGSFVEIRK